MKRKPSNNSAESCLKRIGAGLRLRQQGRVGSTILNSLSDMELCVAYLKCPQCGTIFTSSVRQIVKQAKSVENFVKVCNLLLGIHRYEQHEDQSISETVDGYDKLESVLALKSEVRKLLGNGESVWQTAIAWASSNFSKQVGSGYSVTELVNELQCLVEGYPGLAKKKWLFIFSPESAECLFEVANEFNRMLMACAKLVTIQKYGGMIFGVDDSDHHRTVIPLVVCKPE